MNGLINLIAAPLGLLMKWIYHLVNNYGIAIILFTFITKLILFPISYKQQKSSARMQLLNPKIKKLQERYKDKPEKLQMEQMQLYQDENINPYSSCLTAFIPLILLWGVLAVVYKPMTYILDYDKATIEEAKSIIISIDENSESIENNLEKNSMRQELIIMEKLIRNSDAFQAVIENGEFTFIDTKDNNNTLLKQVDSIDSEFLPQVSEFAETFTLGGVNLSETPSTKISENSSFFLFLIPIISGLLQLALTIYNQKMQKKRNPDMPSMGGMNAMLYIMPLFSVWLAFTVPAGVGFYWVCSSAFSFLQSVILFAWFNDERIEKIGEAERKKAKNSKRRPSMMQKLMEQQEELMRQQEAGNVSGMPANRVRYADSLHEEMKLSRSEMKEYNTAVIREARKRMAEKYGDTGAVSTETEQSPNPKKKKK